MGDDARASLQLQGRNHLTGLLPSMPDSRKQADSSKPPSSRQTVGADFIAAQIAASSADCITIDLRHSGKSGASVRIVVGRGAAADVQTDDFLLSRKHFEFFLDDGFWHIKDLDSKNGTLLNGTPLISPRLVSNEDVVTAGNSSFQISIGD